MSRGEFPHLIFKTISCLYFSSSIGHMNVIIRQQEKQNELLRDIAVKLDAEQNRSPKNESRRF